MRQNQTSLKVVYVRHRISVFCKLQNSVFDNFRVGVFFFSFSK